MASSDLSTLHNRRTTTSRADIFKKAHEQAETVKQFWLLLASVIALLAIVRAVRAITHAYALVYRSPANSTDKAAGEEPLGGTARRRSWRRVLGAVAAAFRIVLFRCTIPIGPGSVASVSELLFVAAYIVATFVWLLVNTEDLNTVFYEDRAAHIASCQLPLIVALAGKNNIISFITGIGHEKLNVLHRAAARTCLILLWIHAVARLYNGLPERFDFTHGWMISGAVGLVAFTFATILSVRPVRHYAFEFFLVSHIVLILVFLVCGFVHTHSPGFGDYLWPALFVWALDRVLRLARVVFNNRAWSWRQDGYSTATVELLGKDTIRLHFRRRMNWAPGQHAYVILPTVSGLPTEAHPFTIAGISGGLDGGKGEANKDVVFLIRAREGFTGRLRKLAATGHTTVPAYIDGPYGCPPDLRRFSTCILIAGGSGVSYTISLLMSIINQANARSSAVSRVVFIWAVRDVEHLRWITDLLNQALAAAPASLAIEALLYVTGKRTSLPSLEYDVDSPVSPVEKEKTAQLPAYSAAKVALGRPDIYQLLDDEIGASSGPVSVDVAGPSALSAAVRRMLRSVVASPSAVLRGRASVELHVETFGMVNA